MSMVPTTRRFGVPSCLVAAALLTFSADGAAIEIDCAGLSATTVSGFAGASADRLSQEAEAVVSAFGQSAAGKMCPISITGFANGEVADRTARTLAGERAARVVAALKAAGVPDSRLSVVRWRPTQDFGATPEDNSRVIIRPNPNAGLKCSALAQGAVGAAAETPALAFNRNVTDLDTAQGAAVEAMAGAIKAENCHFTVEGYASLPGDRRYNRSLARDRARTLRAALVERGVPAARLSLSVGGPTDKFGPSPVANRVAIIVRD